MPARFDLLWGRLHIDTWGETSVLPLEDQDLIPKLHPQNDTLLCVVEQEDEFRGSYLSVRHSAGSSSRSSTGKASCRICQLLNILIQTSQCFPEAGLGFIFQKTIGKVCLTGNTCNYLLIFDSVTLFEVFIKLHWNIFFVFFPLGIIPYFYCFRMLKNGIIAY